MYCPVRAESACGRNRDKSKNTPKTKLKFKDAFEHLEKIVSELESEDADLDVALAKYAEGLELVKFCKRRLEEAENKVKEIRSRFGGEK